MRAPKSRPRAAFRASGDAYSATREAFSVNAGEKSVTTDTFLIATWSKKRHR
jgi:hypothetical protein